MPLGRHLAAAVIALVLMGQGSRAAAAPLDDCNSNDPGKVISGCSEVIAADNDPSTRSAALLRRGWARDNRGQLADAVADFTEALRLAPDAVPALVLRAAIYQRTGRQQQALADYRTAQRLDPRNAQAVAALRAAGIALQPPASPSQAQPAGAAPPGAATQDWVSVAVNRTGRWAWQFDPSAEGARHRALARCGAPGCATAFTVRARCIAYAESRSGGYWYGTAPGWSHQAVQSVAMDRCSGTAPPGTCRVIKNHCQGEA